MSTLASRLEHVRGRNRLASGQAQPIREQVRQLVDGSGGRCARSRLVLIAAGHRASHPLRPTAGPDSCSPSA